MDPVQQLASQMQSTNISNNNRDGNNQQRSNRQYRPREHQNRDGQQGGHRGKTLSSCSYFWKHLEAITFFCLPLFSALLVKFEILF